MGSDELAIRRRLRDDYVHYASRCLKIRTKSGAVEPLTLNRAQEYIHEQLEKQKAQTGKVRALILKGRQQGCSTYIGGRFYWRATHHRGLQVFILTHEQSATDNLFGMVSRYHENNNPLVKPQTGASNAKELYFDKLDSGYSVGTAGSKAVGRSKTVQLFHGSEVAFWPNASAHFAGVVQAVPDEPGTEIILESTAAGIGGEFHSRWLQAELGLGDYIAVFVPWFWQPEYQRSVPADFFATDEEREYAETYGLTMPQLVWRRAKVAELGDDLFKQEYPATASEAFIASGSNVFFDSAMVEAASRRQPERSARDPLIIGVDPSSGQMGADETIIAFRQGRDAKTIPWQSVPGNPNDPAYLMRVAEKVHERAMTLGADMVFVDEGGLGLGIVARLSQLGTPVIGVNFGEGANAILLPSGDIVKVHNKRAEMYAKLRSALPNLAIPDDRKLVTEMSTLLYGYDGAESKILLEKKDDIRERIGRSPDRADALALTYAWPVQKGAGREAVGQNAARKVRNKRTGY